MLPNLPPNLKLPLCCGAEGFKLLASQMSTIDSPDALLAASVGISMHGMPEASLVKVDHQLQRYADLIRSRARGQQPQALLAHMHHFLFEEEKFRGNIEDYYNPDNTFLPAVLHSKLGLPISLSLIYKIVAERLGFRAWGVGLPGHFLAGVASEGKTMLVDPFAEGRLLTPREAHERMQEIFGPEAEWSDDLLQPASNRHWLTRMLQNLLNIYGSAGRYADVAAMLELEILLWPDQARLQRDLGLVLARLGLSEPASLWLTTYLQGNPDDPQSQDLRQLLEVLIA